jgi:hypothetical protein
MAKFEIYKDKRGEYRWRFVADNGRIVAMGSEGYSSKHNCENSVNIIKRQASMTPVEDKTGF